MSAGKFLAGFIVGGIVGGIAGILLAPQSGEKTREMLSESSQDLCDRAQSTVNEIQNKADDICSDIQEKGDMLIEKLQDIIDKQKFGEENQNK